jgi:hypothetical protein
MGHSASDTSSGEEATTISAVPTRPELRVLRDGSYWVTDADGGCGRTFGRKEADAAYRYHAEQVDRWRREIVARSCPPHRYSLNRQGEGRCVRCGIVASFPMARREPSWDEAHRAKKAREFAREAS